MYLVEQKVKVQFHGEKMANGEPYVTKKVARGFISRVIPKVNVKSG